MKSTIITTINNIAITIAHENHETLVPIRPICDALGVSFQSQSEKLKQHPILAPSVTLSLMVGADRRQREMLCLPIGYVFGWLFTIHPDNIKYEARENLIEYQKECYDALFNHFFGKAEKFREREQSFERSILLQNEQALIKFNPNKTVDDFERYLEIERALATETTYRKALTRDSIASVKTLFD